MKPIMGKTRTCSSTTVTSVVLWSSSSQTPGPEVLMEGAEESNKMLSHRPDGTAICRQLGLISDDELGVRAERKSRNQPLGDLGKLASGDVKDTL